MSALDWINSRLKADKARHVVMSAALAVPLAHLPLGLPWAQALAAGAALSMYEAWQYRKGTGHASWNDVAANFAGAGMVALGTLA